MDTALTTADVARIKVSSISKGVLLSILFIFGFYLILRNFFPPFAFIKDVVVLLAGGLFVLETLVSGRIERFNGFDKLVLAFTCYLLIHVFYSWLMMEDFAAAYYGFRLSFLPFLIYFPLKRIFQREPAFRKWVEKYILFVCGFGAMLCIFEFTIVNFLGVDPGFVLRFMSASPSAVGTRLANFLRPIGLAGTPHLSGVLGLLLITFYTPKMIERQSEAKFYSWMLFLLGIPSVLLSTSRTVWTAALVALLTYFVSRIIIRKKVNPWISGTVIVATTLLILSRVQIVSSQTFDTYFGFLGMYKGMVLKWMGPVVEINPILGLGYEVPSVIAVTLSKLDPMFIENQSDIFLVQVFKMLGLLGLGFMMLIFVVYPLLGLFRSTTTVRQKSLVLSMFTIAITFGHYNPLSSPSVAIVVCWLLVELGMTLDERVVGQTRL